MESGGDWRSQLQSGVRQSVVDLITDNLKKRSPLSVNEGLKEIKKNAEKVEEKMYTDATSESDYVGKIYLKMEEMENISQNPVTDVVMQLDFAANTVNPSVNPSDPALLDSTPQNGNPNDEDWQEQVYQKIKAMKDLYLKDLNDMHQQTLGKLQKLDSLPQQPDNGLLEKLRAFKSSLEWYMQFLQIPKHPILAICKENLASYEFEIVKIVNFKKRKPAPQQQQAQNPPPHMHSGGSLQQNARSGPQQVNITPMPLQQNGVMCPGNWSITQGACGVVGDSSIESRDWRSQLQADSRQRSVNKITDTLKRHSPLIGNEGLKELKKIAENFEEKMYTEATSESDYMRNISSKMLLMENKPQNPMPNAVKSNSAAISVNPSDPAVASLDLTAENCNPDGEDWQEEVYQKIKAMKDLYLQDLKDMHQEILDKLQKHDSLPQQPDNGQLEKLRVFKMMLERFMHFLQIPKHDILANYTDKLATFEMQIVNVVNSNKRKAVAQDQQPQAPLPPHMHSGGFLQQNVLRGPQQENINPTSLQKDGTVTAVNSNKRKRVGRKKQQQAPPPPHVQSVGSLQQNMPSGPQQVNINPASLQQNLCKRAVQQQQQQAPLPPHVHSGGSLQQNTMSGPQQVNIYPTSLQHYLGGSGASGGFTESSNWKARMTADSRRSIANKITDSLKTHLQYYGFEGIPELMKISERFEESVYTAATSQSEYLQILSLKMMDLETNQQHFRPDGYMH